VSLKKLRAALAEMLSPNQDANAAQPVNLPVDLNEALEATDGDRHLLIEAVRLFLEHDYPRHLKALKEGLARQDARAIKAAAHGIKGAVGSFGGQAAHKRAGGAGGRDGAICGFLCAARMGVSLSFPRSTGGS